MDDCKFKNQDKLILRGLQFYGFHGVHSEEKKQGQKFLVDIDAWLDLRIAGETDNIIDTVSYTDIYRIAKEIMEGPSQNLLESVAHLIANSILAKYPMIYAVRVKVCKPDVLVHGPIDYLGIEILRSRVNNEIKQPSSISSFCYNRANASSLGISLSRTAASKQSPSQKLKL